MVHINSIVLSMCAGSTHGRIVQLLVLPSVVIRWIVMPTVSTKTHAWTVTVSTKTATIVTATIETPAASKPPAASKTAIKVATAPPAQNLYVPPNYASTAIYHTCMLQICP